MSDDIKSQVKTFSKFLQFYDYSYWDFKLKTLYKAIEDEEFLKDVSKQFTRGGDVGKLRNRLVSEVLFTNLHMIECLFLLMGAFTYNPKNPWAWINDKKNYPGKIASPLKDGKFKTLYENLKPLGVKSLGDYVVYLFYNVPTTPEWNEKIKTLIEPTVYALREIAFEFHDKRDLYNAYKHGAISMPVETKLSKVNGSGKKEVILEPFPALMYIPKGGKKSRLDIDDLNVESFLEPMPDYVPLNYEREKKIGNVILTLIKNLISVRKAIVVERAPKVGVIILPSLKELRSVFFRPVLNIEKISLDEYKKRLEKGEL